MNFQFAHYNYNVIDLDKICIRFYEEALGLKELQTKRLRTEALSLFTWRRERDLSWSLHGFGTGKRIITIWEIMIIHLAFTVDDMEAAHKKHQEMGCICFENPAMGIYFINDPDGYWLEIVPAK